MIFLLYTDLKCTAGTGKIFVDTVLFYQKLINYCLFVCSIAMNLAENLHRNLFLAKRLHLFQKLYPERSI